MEMLARRTLKINKVVGQLLIFRVTLNGSTNDSPAAARNR